jgi:hypothetical protein
MILFLIVTYSLNPRKRRFPTSYQLWLCVSSIICTTGIDLAVLVGGTITFLRWKVERLTQEPSKWTVQTHSGPERTYCTWDDSPVLQSFDGARDNDGQGVVCVLQGTECCVHCLVRSLVDAWLTQICSVVA